MSVSGGSWISTQGYSGGSYTKTGTINGNNASAGGGVAGGIGGSVVIADTPGISAGTGDIGKNITNIPGLTLGFLAAGGGGVSAGYNGTQYRAFGGSGVGGDGVGDLPDLTLLQMQLNIPEVVMGQ